MTDRIPGAPGRYSASLPNGEIVKMQNGEPFAITLTRDDDPIVEGTPYSKASVLPDELAAKLCPNLTDPAPKDAFAALHKITAEGTSGGWTYRKWENGVAECYHPVIALNYAGARWLTKQVTLPFTISAPAVSITLMDATKDSALQSASVLTYSEAANGETMSFSLIKDAGGFTEGDYARVSVKITGLWKQE